MDEKLDYNTGKTAKELEKLNIVASTYDCDGNYYIIKRDKKIYRQDGNDFVEVADPKIIKEVLDNFIAKRRDIIKDEGEAEK